MIYVVDYIVTFGASVAVFQALADTLKTKVDRNQRNVPKIKISEVMHMSYTINMCDTIMILFKKKKNSHSSSVTVLRWISKML